MEEIKPYLDRHLELLERTREEVLEGLRGTLRRAQHSFPGLPGSSVEIIKGAIAYLEGEGSRLAEAFARGVGSCPNCYGDVEP